MNPRKTLYGIVSLMGTFFLSLLFLFTMGIKIEADTLDVPGFNLQYTTWEENPLTHEQEQVLVNYPIGEWNNSGSLNLVYDKTVENAENYKYHLCTIKTTDDCSKQPTKFSQTVIDMTFDDGQYILYISDETDSSTPVISSYQINVDNTAPTPVSDSSNLLFKNSSTSTSNWKKTFKVSYSDFSYLAYDIDDNDNFGSGISKVEYATCSISQTDCSTGIYEKIELNSDGGSITISTTGTYMMYYYDHAGNVSNSVFKFYIDNTMPSMEIVAPDFTFCDENCSTFDSSKIKWLLSKDKRTTSIILRGFGDNNESGIASFGYRTEKVKVTESGISKEKDISSDKSHTFNSSVVSITQQSIDYVYSILEEGYYRVTFYIEDNAGNKMENIYYFAISDKPTFNYTSDGYIFLDSLKYTEENGGKIISLDILDESTYYNVGEAGFSHYEYKVRTLKDVESEWTDWNSYTKYENSVSWNEDKFYDFAFRICNAVGYCSDDLILSEVPGKDILYLDSTPDSITLIPSDAITENNTQYINLSVIAENVISETAILVYSYGTEEDYTDGSEDWFNLSLTNYTLNRIYKQKSGSNQIMVFYQDLEGNETYEAIDLESSFNYLKLYVDFSDNEVISHSNDNLTSISITKDESPFNLSQICYSWTKEKTPLTEFATCEDFEVINEEIEELNYGFIEIDGFKEYLFDKNSYLYDYILADTSSSKWYLNIAAMDETGEIVINSKMYTIDFDNPILNIEGGLENNTWTKSDFSIVIKLEDNDKTSKLQFEFYDLKDMSIMKLQRNYSNTMKTISVVYNYVELGTTIENNDKSYTEFSNSKNTNDGKSFTTTLKLKITNSNWFNSYDKSTSSFIDGGKFKLVVKGYDINGNVSEAVTYINVDRTSDNLEIKWTNLEGYEKEKTFDFKVSNKVSDIVKYCYLPGEYDSTSEEIQQCVSSGASGNIKNNGWWTFYIQDAAGNETFLKIEVKNIDKTAPSYRYIGATWNYHASWSKDTVTINVEIFDTNSNLKKVGYAFVREEVMPSPNNLSSISVQETTLTNKQKIALSYPLTQTGVFYLVIKVSDIFENTALYVVGPDVGPDSIPLAYNDDNKKFILDNYKIKVDMIAPNMENNLKVYYDNEDQEVAPLINKWYNKNLYLKFTSSDEGSGNLKIKYRLLAESAPDVESVQLLLNDVNGTLIKENTFFEIKESGRYKIFFVATDEAGNVSALYRQSILLDKEAPVPNGKSAVSSSFLNEIEVISKEDSMCGYQNIMNLTVINNIKDAFTTNDNDLTRILAGVSLSNNTSGYLESDEMAQLLCTSLGSNKQKQYYLHIKVMDLAGNVYEEFYPFILKGSVPPQISLNVEVLKPLIEEKKIELICVNEEGREVECDLDNLLMPRKINIAIGTSFVPFLEATIKYKNGTINKITNNDFYVGLDFDREGSVSYICFEATDPSNSAIKTGDVRLCSDTEKYIEELKQKYDTSVDAYLNSDLYLSAINNRIELRIAYIEGPYLSFDKDSVMDDVELGKVDETKIIDYETQYISRDNYITSYVESGVYYRDVNGIHELFENDLGEGKLIGYEIKKWDNNVDKSVCPINVNELTANLLNSYWSSKCFLEERYTDFSSIDGEIYDNYFIKYFEQNRASGIMVQNIYRRVQIYDFVPDVILNNMTDNTINVSAVNINNDNYHLFLDNYFMCSSDQCDLDISVYKYDNKNNKEIAKEKMFVEYPEDGVLKTKQYLDKREMGIYYLYVKCTRSSQTNTISSSTVKIVVNILDTTGPVITVIPVGNSINVILDYNDRYIEKWATAIDEIDGEITTIAKSIKYIDKNGNAKDGVSSVDTSVLGTYIITYTAIDKSGLSTSKYRYVYVVDKTNPSIEFADDKTNASDGVTDYAFTLERGKKLQVKDLYKRFIKGVSDNYNSNLTIDDVVCFGEIDTSKVGNYILTYRLSDYASSYNVEGDGTKPFQDNVYEVKVKIIVKDTIKPMVSIYDVNEALEESERKIALEEGKVFKNLFTGVHLNINTDIEYGDSLRIFLNGFEQDFDDIGVISNNGYYDFKIIDSSGNFVYLTFGINNDEKLSIYSDALEETEITIDTNKTGFSLIDHENKKVHIRIEQGEYQAGDTLLISHYDNSGKFYVSSSFEITEREVQILAFDDYTLIMDVELENVDHLFSFVIDKETSQNLNFIEKEEIIEEKSNNMVVTLAALGGVGVILIVLLIKMKKKKKQD